MNTTLVDAISYQDGSVVSRELINQQGGTITLFAFDINQGLSTHTAPYDAFVEILDGQAEVNLNDELHHLKAGDFLIMPARSPHALKAVSRFKMLLTMIRS
ncbi:MAG TPA: cupin domain-containing protein [Patescibacteria group bacterium]